MRIGDEALVYAAVSRILRATHKATQPMAKKEVCEKVGQCLSAIAGSVREEIRNEVQAEIRSQLQRYPYISADAEAERPSSP